MRGLGSSLGANDLDFDPWPHLGDPIRHRVVEVQADGAASAPPQVREDGELQGRAFRQATDSSVFQAPAKTSWNNFFPQKDALGFFGLGGPQLGVVEVSLGGSFTWVCIVE